MPNSQYPSLISQYIKSVSHKSGMGWLSGPILYACLFGIIPGSHQAWVPLQLLCMISILAWQPIPAGGALYWMGNVTSSSQTIMTSIYMQLNNLQLFLSGWVGWGGQWITIPKITSATLGWYYQDRIPHLELQLITQKRGFFVVFFCQWHSGLAELTVERCHRAIRGQIGPVWLTDGLVRALWGYHLELVVYVGQG